MVGSGIFGIRNINVWQLMLFVKKKYIYIYLKRKNLQEVHASGHNFAKIIQQSLYHLNPNLYKPRALISRSRLCIDAHLH